MDNIKDVKVSVIIPVYNGEKFLEKAYTYFCNQTLKEIEFIFVNDASTDKSVDIISKFTNEFPDKFILLNNEKNKGPGAARNLGISSARGKYIGFVDCDDAIKPKMFELLYNKAEKENDDIVMCSYFSEKDNTTTAIDARKFDNGLTHEARVTLVMHTGYVWQCMFKKEFLESFSKLFREAYFYEDIDFLFEAYSRAERVGIVSRTLYNYNNSGENLTSNKSYTTEKHKYLVEELFKSTLERCCTGKYFDEIKDIIEYKLLGNAVSLLMTIIKNNELSYESVNRLNKFIKSYIKDYYKNPYINNYTRYSNKNIKSEILKSYDNDSKKFYNNIKKLGIQVN